MTQSSPKAKISDDLVSQDEKEKYTKLLMDVGDGKIGPELAYLLGSRYKILYITSNEERRVVDCLRILSVREGYKLYQWDLNRGMMDVDAKKQVSSSQNEIHKIPDAALGWIIEQAKQDNKANTEKQPRAVKGYVYILHDFHHFLRGEGTPLLERMFKEFASIPSVCSIVLVAPNFECPAGLETEVTLVDFPYPSKSEIRRSLKSITKNIPAKFPEAIKFAKEREEDLLNSLTGLTLTEAENALAKTLVKNKKFDIATILEEKRQMIRKNGIIEYRESRFKFEDIGGLDTLKEWLTFRKMAFSDDATQFGLDSPKGVLLLGIPGTGKSMTCDALASYYEMPLLRLDVGSIFGSLVGESEQNMRNVIKIAESVAPAILWIDEIEKGIGGVKSSNQTDSGVTSRVFGTLLTWMQEKQSAVFVVCTANNVSDIPPEFTRAGRFDEIFFVDLPTREQREEVCERLLLKKQRNPDDFDLKAIAAATDNYSPAEIEKAINNALFVAYSDKKRSLTTQDIVVSAGKFQPLYNTRREEIEASRKWALGENGSGGRAVLANAKPKEIIDYSSNSDRVLDL